MRSLALAKSTGFVWLFCLTALLSAQTITWQAPTSTDFPIVGGNLANHRYSTLTKIDKSNVAKLGGAWMVHVENGQRGWMQATPIVVDGIMYMATGHIWARDARTGALKWQYPIGDAGPGYGPGGGPNSNFNRGVVIAEGKVFSAATGSTLIALDQKTGAVVWRTELGGARGFANAPAIYYDGLVYMGVGGGEQGVRGQFGAYDAKTGKEVWKFWTVPGPGEFGNDSWEGDSWQKGGAPVWTHPAIDAELGMVYVPTGNAWPDTDGTKRAGDNLFSASIVALDLKTGKYKWHFQEVHHDLWDYDSPVGPVLADITYQNRSRKILMHGGKTGMMYILDRTNGTPLIGIEERPVPQLAEQNTAKTQPFPIGDAFVPTCPEPDGVPPGMKSGCVFTPFLTEPIAIQPGTNGGLSWAPMTYSPQTKLLYVCGTIIATGFSQRGFMGIWQTASQEQWERARGGTMTAMDPTTNKIVWQKRLKWPCGSGSGLLSTASGLLFHGESDGNIAAHDITNGDVLWKFQTGAGADAPVATYEVDGEQYVAILAGGSQYMGSSFGDNLWAFKLGGAVPPAAAPPTRRAPVIIAPAPSVTAPTNLDFSRGETGGVPDAWLLPPAQTGFRVRLSDDGPAAAVRSAVIRYESTGQPEGLANFRQRIAAASYRGKTIRFRAAVRVKGGANVSARLFVRVERASGQQGFFDDAADHPITSAAWANYEIAGRVDDDAQTVIIGMRLYGSGEAAIASASFQVIGPLR